jgi:hypothetical protein
MTYLLTLYILLDTAHVASPFVLAWWHKGFRHLMIHQAHKYIVPPLLVFAIGAMVTGFSVSGRGVCWATMIKAYTLWNFFHFSMQNYGVLRLCGLRDEVIGKVIAFSATAVGIMTMPFAVSVHHWLTDIGLSTRVMGRQGLLFATVLFCLAPIAFLWDRAPWVWPELPTIGFQPMTPLIILWVGLRLSTGFAHFSISARLWKMSDPQVRATIGRDLLRQRGGAPCEQIATDGAAR